MNNKQIKAADAHGLLENPVLQDAFNEVKLKIWREMQQGTEPPEKLVLKVQLLDDIIKMIESYIDEGLIEDHKTAEKVIKPPVFNRGL